MEKKGNGICVAAMVLGILSCCCDPLFLVLIAAIVLGFVGLFGNYSGKWMAGVGLGFSALTIVIEIVAAILTMGMSLFF